MLASKIPAAMVLAVDSSRVDDEGFVQSDLYGLNALAEVCGVEALDLPEDTVRVVTEVMRAHPDSEYVQATGLAFLDKVKDVLLHESADSAEAELRKKLRVLSGFHRASVDWQMIASAGSAPYFHNGATGESSWEQPEAHANFTEGLTDFVAAVDDLARPLSGDFVSEATQDMVGFLRTHARDSAVCGRVVHLFHSVSKKDNAADLVADDLPFLLEHEVLPPLDHCGNVDAQLVDDATELLTNLRKSTTSSKSKKKKTPLLSSLREYVRVLNQTCLDHIDNATVVNRCVAILANLAFNNAEVIGYEFDVNVPYTLKWALQHYLLSREESAGEYCEVAVFAASCLLTDDEPRTKYVCDQLLPEFAQALTRFAGVPSFYSKCTRCVGAFSFVEDCVSLIVVKEVLPRIVAGIDLHLSDAKVLKYAVDVLSNVGRLDDDAVAAAIIDSGAIPAIRRVLDAHSSFAAASLVAACFDVLYNVGERAARLVTDEGLCDKALDCLSFDYERHLRIQSAKLVSVLTYDEYSAQRLCKAVPVLLDAVASSLTYEDDGEFLVDCALSLSNLVTLAGPSRAREVFLETRYLKDCLFDLLDRETVSEIENPSEVHKLALIILVRLAAVDDDLARRIAEDGMPCLMRLATRYLQQQRERKGVLSLMFELLRQLAFSPQNLRAIVGAGGVKVLLETIQEERKAPELLVKALATIDNLVSADLEYALVVQEHQGERKLEACLQSSSSTGNDDDDVRRAGEAALLSLRATLAQKESQRTNRAALFARLGEGNVATQKLEARQQDAEPEDDPLRRCRDLLTAGSVLKVWDKGKATSRKLTVNADWSSFLTRDASRTAAVQGRLPFRTIRLARLGYGGGHQVKSRLSSKLKPTAREDCCVVLKGHVDEDLLCCECHAPGDAARLVDAVQTTLAAFTKWPHRLVRG
mmetsp:Transcript_4951/g.15520  ORF Transcript_4951/g.15520 Transcript_4951/m.15520 type:complete len:927 (+) Transcript_4951:946-3726(+)